MASFEKRTTREGKHSFRVKIRLRGFPQQNATFEQLTDARRWAKSTEAAIREGRYFSSSEARKHTCAELINRYVREVVPSKPRTGPQQVQQLAWWKERLGSYRSDLTPALIAQYGDELASGNTRYGAPRAPATVIRYLAALSHAFSVAITEWGWIGENPLRKVRRPTEPKGRVRFLSDDERERFLLACRQSGNPFLYGIVLLAVSTGMRKGEIPGLKWNDVDLKRGWITLHVTKNNERRKVPLAGPALEALRQHAKVRRIDSELVFPGQDSARAVDIRVAWEKAIQRAQISNFVFHDLRHSAASYLLMSGASLGELAEVLGHRTLEMVKRYAHLSEAHTAGIVTRMNERIFGRAAN